MVSPLFSAKPSVLRCGRCGRFVDWADARLQLVCGCRSHVDLPPVEVRPCAESDRAAVLDLFQRDFGTTRIGAFDAEHALVDVPALVAMVKEGAEKKSVVAGALAYRFTESALQMLALATDPMWQRSGVGGQLVDHAEQVARNQGKTVAMIATSNDNLPALYFYQRHGYHIAHVALGALMGRAAGRPGFAGIAVRDEIRLEKSL